MFIDVYAAFDILWEMLLKSNLKLNGNLITKPFELRKVGKEIWHIPWASIFKTNNLIIIRTSIRKNKAKSYVDKIYIFSYDYDSKSVQT